MGREEQKEEREVLDSIYPDEITDISESSYRIAIALEAPSLDEEDETEPPTMLLQVSYPEDYPDVAPDLDLQAPHDSAKHPFLNIAEDKEELLSALQPTIEENLGMIMIFTLLDSLKEAAESLISSRQTAIQAEKEAEAARVEEEENRKFQGTAVTPASFMEWRAKFRKELEEEEQRRKEEREAEEKKKRGPKEEKRMTGRQLWESGLAKGDEDEDEEEATMPPTEQVEKLTV